eukprot:gene52025-36031_t
MGADDPPPPERPHKAEEGRRSPRRRRRLPPPPPPPPRPAGTTARGLTAARVVGTVGRLASLIGVRAGMPRQEAVKGDSATMWDCNRNRQLWRGRIVGAQGKGWLVELPPPRGQCAKCVAGRRARELEAGGSAADGGGSDADGGDDLGSASPPAAGDAADADPNVCCAQCGTTIDLVSAVHEAGACPHCDCDLSACLADRVEVELGDADEEDGIDAGAAPPPPPPPPAPAVLCTDVPDDKWFTPTPYDFERAEADERGRRRTSFAEGIAEGRPGAGPTSSRSDGRRSRSSKDSTHSTRSQKRADDARRLWEQGERYIHVRHEGTYDWAGAAPPPEHADDAAAVAAALTIHVYAPEIAVEVGIGDCEIDMQPRTLRLRPAAGGDLWAAVPLPFPVDAASARA